MTAIAAVSKAGQTWIGSDGKTFKGTAYFNSGPKFIQMDGWAVAHCDRAAAWQIVTMEIGKFKAPKKMDIRGVYAFGQWVKKTLVAHGVKKEAADNDDLPDHPLEMIVATAAGGLFRISGDGHVSQHRRFITSGAGTLILTGALEALHGNKLDAKCILNKALEISIKSSHWCERPIHLAEVL